jgi:hypothetical protein
MMQLLFRSNSLPQACPLELLQLAVIYLPVIRRLLLSLLCLPALILTSCVEGEEEVWINPDASGRFMAHYEIPSIALSQMSNPDDMIRALRMIDEKEEGIEITKLSFEKKGSKAILHLKATFKDVRKLLEISDRNEDFFAKEAKADPEQMDAIAGVINFGLDGLTPTFTRSVSLDGLFPAMISERPKMLGPSNFKYTIHLPAEVKTHNAHSVSEDGRTVSWTFLLKDHFEQPMEMAFTTALPIPWWAWLALAILVFGIAWLIWRKVLRR